MRRPAFYPSPCHPIARRSFLKGALGATAALTLGLPRRARAGALDDTTPIILTYATRRDDPWAIVHGIRAMGPAFTVAGGERAVSYVLSEFLEERSAPGGRYLAFPAEVERHQNMFLKTFLEAGVSPEFRFPFQGKRRSLQEVIDGARPLFRFSDATDRNTIAWSLIALTRTTPPARGTWTNAWGERVELGRVAQAGLEALEQASGPIREARERGVVPERQALIHAFTCGGTHLVYSLLVAAHTGYLGPEARKRLRQQMDLLVYRLSVDIQMIDRFYVPQLDTVPGMGWYLLDSRIKFVGHTLECLGFAKRHGLYAVPAAEAPRYREAGAVLDGDLRQLHELDLEPVRANIHDLYQQLVGDVCHARHGLRLV